MLSVKTEHDNEERHMKEAECDFRKFTQPVEKETQSNVSSHARSSADSSAD